MITPKVKKAKKVAAQKSPTVKKVNFKQEFISRILGNGTNWPREMKIMNKLAEEYPEEGFWRSVSLSFKIPSLAWFLTEKGMELLSTEYKKFHFVPSPIKLYESDIVKENVDFETENPIIIEAPRKLKSVKEFLKLWGQNKKAF